jgi:hypothetical protein
MGLVDFKKPPSDWMAEFEEHTEARGFLLDYRWYSDKSTLFLIEGDGKCAIGKTHHCRAEDRDRPYISLRSAEEANWRENPQDIPSTNVDDYEIVDIFGIVIDHRSPNGYQQDPDNFLVLTEDILEDIPESGKKEFRVRENRYRDPYGRHKNSWDRLFENIE